MSRTATSHKQDIRGQVKTGLMDRLTAVQAALSEMPMDTAAPGNLADAFIMVDPVLCTLNRQRLDAQENYNRLSHAFGFDDAMVEVAAMQRAATEQAYTARLKALRRRREESDRASAMLENGELELQGKNRAKATSERQRSLKQEEERLLSISRELEQKHQRDRGDLWLWAFLILGLGKPASTHTKPALRLA